MSLARHLRKNAIAAERKVWRKLRNRKVAGYKFRRQHELGPYILDFYCPELRIAIEPDGGDHGYVYRQLRDREPAKFLDKQGIAVLRFWNRQIYKEFDNFCDRIWFAVERRAKNPSPKSSPLKRERE